MALQVFLKNQSASRRFEIEFFRKFASELSRLFEIRSFEGVLLGFPTTKESEFLFPDAVIITPNSIVIVDFKKYDGIDGGNIIVSLPPDDRFRSDPWMVRAATPTTRPNSFPPVSSGSANNRNPFDQLEKQVERLSQVLTRKNLHARIHSMVVFHGDNEVTFDGAIPGRYQGRFSIASRDFLSKIDESLNIRNFDGAFPVDKIRSLFEAAPYKEIVPIDISAFPKIAELEDALQKATLRAEDLQKETLRIRSEIEKRGSADTTEVAELKRQLQIAEARAEQAISDYESASAERQLEVDNDNAQLAAAIQLAKEKTKQVREEARKAQAEQRTAEANLAIKKEELLSELLSAKKSKVAPRAIFAGALTALVLVSGVFVFGQKQVTSSPELRCVGVLDAEQLVGGRGCVEFAPLDVKGSNSGKTLYLNNDKKWFFTVEVRNPSDLFGNVDFETQFEGKKMKVTGNVWRDETPNGVQYKMTVTKKSQIEFVN